MTFEGDTTQGSSRTMKIMVILFIVWVAYWAATGGLDQIVVPEEQSTTSILSLL